MVTTGLIVRLEAQGRQGRGAGCISRGCPSARPERARDRRVARGQDGRLVVRDRRRLPRRGRPAGAPRRRRRRCARPSGPASCSPRRPRSSRSTCSRRSSRKETSHDLRAATSSRDASSPAGSAAGIEITLYWSAADNSTSIEVWQPESGETLAFAVPPERALDAFYHPFAHLTLASPTRSRRSAYDREAIAGRPVRSAPHRERARPRSRLLPGCRRPRTGVRVAGSGRGLPLDRGAWRLDARPVGRRRGSAAPLAPSSPSGRPSQTSWAPATTSARPG